MAEPTIPLWPATKIRWFVLSMDVNWKAFNGARLGPKRYAFMVGLRAAPSAYAHHPRLVRVTPDGEMLTGMAR